MKKNDFVFNAALNTLTISAAFAKKASNVNSMEYRKLVELRRNNPSLIVKQRTHESGNRLTYKDMEARLYRIDKNGKLVEAFKIVKEIAKTESAPYTYVYNWFKAQMEAAKAEKQSEKKASEASKEDLKKKLAELTSGISYNATREVMDNFVDHEMNKGNRVSAINTRIRGLRVFFNYCAEYGFIHGFKYPLIREDESVKVP